MIDVGIGRASYPEVRNFLSLPLRRYRHRPVFNACRIPAWLYSRLGRRGIERYGNSFLPIGSSGCAIHHLFNGVSLGATPWISSFETFVPRWSQFLPGEGRWGLIAPRDLRRGLERLAGDPCRRLVAISRCAARIQEAFLAEAAPDLASAISRKITVLHPSQAVRPDISRRSWCQDGVVRFCFVGRQFFVKGGAEVLSAFHRLHLAGYRNWRLRIVSSLETQPDRPHLTSMSHAQIAEVVAACSPLVSVTPALSNADVLMLLGESDVSLLPSYADTYGYVVLESQASGTPVITTNVRALPEVNSESCGWVVPLEVDALGYAKIAVGSEFESARLRLDDGLFDVLESICLDPELVRPKGLRAVDQVRERHQPEAIAGQLESIYDEALS